MSGIPPTTRAVQPEVSKYSVADIMRIGSALNSSGKNIGLPNHKLLCSLAATGVLPPRKQALAGEEWGIKVSANRFVHKDGKNYGICYEAAKQGVKNRDVQRSSWADSWSSKNHHGSCSLRGRKKLRNSTWLQNVIFLYGTNPQQNDTSLVSDNIARHSSRRTPHTQYKLDRRSKLRSGKNFNQ
ncbi:hypothetical protein PHLCEN_2v2672 [Hermanssonia centrifuga]|uniref:Uncharacterized protein n=1 Tax=Hermanssonia centrifuga TaxID=98765 RepID=A0A2R6RII4_9APHY|nr:hypothetical protein PHLCEN_2v2672 [Hermanssonia centrifuga]